MRKIIAISVLLGAAIGLVACGGGGSGSTTPTPKVDTTAPQLTLATSSPASTTTTIVVTANEDLGGNVAITVKNSATTTLSGSTTLNPGNRGMTWTSTSGELACNTVYSVTATATDLAGNTGTMNGTVTTAGCPAASWWPPTTITPVGTKVFGANQLPAGCNAWNQQCWKDAVANGTVKFVASGGTNAGRAVVFAYFRNTTVQFGVNGLWNYLPIYADDGSLVGSDIFGGDATEVEWIVGSANGAIVRGGGQCFERFNAGSTWSNRSVICPF